VKERKILRVAGSHTLSAERARCAAERVKGDLPHSTKLANSASVGRQLLGHFGTSDRSMSASRVGRVSKAR
jgi:hypothetical protein